MAQTTESTAFRYHAFISYSHQDKTWADWLHKTLESYAIPRRLVGQTTAAGVIPSRLTPIFRDRDELASAHDLGGKVNAALAQSANLIVICSPHSATSRWVNEEVRSFKRLGRSERIFCLIVDGEPNASELPGREAEECFAPALRFPLDADGQFGTEPTEPIAADARPGMDGKDNAKLKLIAGMLDLGFDRLKQRELKRRTRRMTAIAALAVVVMAVTTTLAVFAMISRHAAEVARVAADTARQDAERRQKQAEDLVDFMLGDLNDKLAQVQRLDIMQGVDDKAMAYFASLPSHDVTDNELAARAKALEKIGTVRGGQGHLKAALEAFEASAKISATLARAAPTDTARQLAYARTLTFIGTNRWYQGQLEAAQASFEAAQNVLARTARVAVSNHDLQFELEMIDNDLGHVLEARGQLDQAVALYKSALSLASKLVAADSDNTAWALELGGAHNNLGKLALLHGDLAAAIAEYRADDTIETALATRHPKDNDQRESALTVRAILGRTLALAGDDTTGVSYLQQAVDTAAALRKIDPGNTDFEEESARYAVQLARLQRLHDDAASAQTLIRRALTDLHALSEKDPANAGFQRELAEALTEQAAESLAAHHPDIAVAQLQSALAKLAPLLAKQPHHRDLVLDTLDAQWLLARSSPDSHLRADLLNKIITTAQAQEGGRDDPRLIALQVEALLGLARTSDARPMLDQLQRDGYRDPAFLQLLREQHIAYRSG